MRPYFRLSFLLTVLFSLVIAMFSGLSNRNAQHESIIKAIFDIAATHADQACWHDLCPGKTTFDDALTRLQQLGPWVSQMKLYDRGEIDWTVNTDPPIYVSADWIDPNPQPDGDSPIPKPPPHDLPLSVLMLSSVYPMSLGEMIALLGTPTTLGRFCFKQMNSSGQPFPRSILFDVYYANGISFRATGMATQIRQDKTARSRAWGAPTMTVDFFIIGEVAPPSEYYDTQPWRGFGGIEDSFNC
jgi:hypothetical protein